MKNTFDAWSEFELFNTVLCGLLVRAERAGEIKREASDRLAKDLITYLNTALRTGEVTIDLGKGKDNE